MKDARGREIRVGDIVATPWPEIGDPQVSAEQLARLPDIIKGAILGEVIEIVELFEGDTLHLGDGILYGPEEVITLGGLEWVKCPECGFSWPFDTRMNAEEECPFCGASYSPHGWTWVCQWCGMEYPDTHPNCACRQAQIYG